tara:strand:- start:39 stop:770 length:732 start_codon:yes stop_codon:yes gene_type:complete
MSIALIDADYLVYSMAAWAQDNQADQFEMHERIEDNIEVWMQKTGCDNSLFAFSCSRDDNYRRDYYPPYKTNRTAEAPSMLRAARQGIEAISNTITMPRLEADDIMGILATKPSEAKVILVSVDKDLRTIPGWHLNPNVDESPVEVSQEDAMQMFLTQWLTGDSTDGYGGIKGVGPAKARKILEENPTPQGVVEAYLDKGYTMEETTAQAACARILQYEDWNPETKQVIPMDLIKRGWYSDEG